MSLRERISEDLKRAMRDKNERIVSVLRMLNSAVKDKEISLRRDGEKAELSEEQMTETIFGEIKKRKDAVAAYANGGRKDLADKENEEIAVLDEYVPEQISDEEIEKIAQEIVAEQKFSSMSDFGQAMKLIMPKVKGRAEGNRVGETLKKILAG